MSNVFKWGCGLLVVATLVLGGVATFYGVRFWNSSGVGDAFGAGLAGAQYLQAVQDKNWDQAHVLLSSELQKTVTPAAIGEAWQRYEATHGAMQPHTDPTTQNQSQQPGYFVADADGLTVTNTDGKQTAIFKGSMNFATSGVQPMTLRLVKENERWKMAELPFSQT
ncbi:MAG: DUF3887 domain-containing protein [Chloroflexaceae bacterium]|jgi:hypothetical protein|nr:DUF3887 domain-containing protein [Chloroflexaceae bacterium]